jgi:HK97 family phage prohead protease/HK97 family phage major capsid protein
MTIRYTKGIQSEADPFEFVMSDDSEDRVGDVIDAGGWDLRDFKKNPIALYGHDHSNPIGTWKKVRVEGNKLLGVLELAAEGTSAFIDTLRKLISQRILKAVSVGFKPTKYEEIADSKRGGLKFLGQELLECSLVAVPANPNALSLAKALSTEDRQRLFAESGILRSPDRRSTAEPGTPKRKSTEGVVTLAERIQARQTELIAFKDQLTPIAKKIEDDVDLDDAEQVQFEELTTQIDEAEKTLATWRRAEKALGARSTPASPLPSGSVTSPAPVQSRHLERNKGNPSDLLIRMAVCHLQAHAQRISPDQVRQIRYPDREDVEAGLGILKTATQPARTTVAGWAAELVSQGVAEFIDNLGPDSVYQALKPRGVTFSFDRNGTLRIPRRLGGSTAAVGAPGDLRGAFVGEGAPIPVRRGAVSSVQLVPHKMGVISTYTREMAMHSTPAIEGLIREGIIEDTAIAVDIALLDAVAGDAIRPAGLLNGVVGGTPTAGGGIAAMTTDLQNLIAPFTAANAANGLVLLINPAKVFALSWASTAVGVYPFRDQVAAGNIGGIPFIASTMIPATTIIMVRAADFATATGDTPEFDVSDVATIHEDDSTYLADQKAGSTVLPIATGAAGSAVVATPVRSLWQTASIGIRMILDMDWVMRRPGMVQFTAGITW